MKKEFDFFDLPGNIRMLKRIFYGVLVLLFILDFLVEKHGMFPWENMPGFNAAYGFFACVGIVLFSNLLGYFLKKKEDYYE